MSKVAERVIKYLQYNREDTLNTPGKNHLYKTKLHFLFTEKPQQQFISIIIIYLYIIIPLSD